MKHNDGYTTKPPCSKMWTDLFLDARHQGIKTCCHKNLSPLTYDQIRRVGPEIFNSHPDTLADREHFLTNDTMPDSCDPCQRNWPDLTKNPRNEWRDRVFSHRDLDALRTGDRIKVIDLYLSRTCNQTCLYCNSGFSSDWAKLLGETYDDSTEWQAEMLQALYGYVRDRSRNVEPQTLMFEFGGGEPFLNPNIFRVMQSLMDAVGSERKHDILFCMTSNLNVKPALIDKLIAMADANPQHKWWLTCSIDAIGEAGEHIRNGLDFNLFSSNLRRVLGSDRIGVSVQPSVNNVSLPDMPNLLRWVLDLIEETKSRKKALEISGHLVTYPGAMHISTLPSSYRSYIDECRSIVAGTEIGYYADHLDSIEGIIGTKRGEADREGVRAFYDRMGRLHNKDYFAIFKALDDIVNGDDADWMGAT